MLKHIICLLILWLFFAGDASSQTPAQTLPEFKFFRLDNRPFTNNQLPKNKNLVFVFFDSDCEHCQRAVQTIGQQYVSFKKAAVFLVSVDDPNKINFFMNKYGKDLKGRKNLVILQDRLNQFIIKFKPRKYPGMFLYSLKKQLLAYEDNPEMVVAFVKHLPAK